MIGKLYQWFGYRRNLARIPAAQILAAPRAVPILPMASKVQWERVSAVVQLSLTRVEAVNNTQSLARQQLDVADYALQAMMADLRIVMPGMRRAHSQP